MRRLFLLILGSLAFWVLVSLPARALDASPESADRTIAYSGVALLICIVPMAVTLVWTNRLLEQPSEQQVALILGGTGLRMFAILIVGWIVFATIPYFHSMTFMLWLVGAYMFTLVLEVTLLLTGRHENKTDGAGQA